MLRSIQGYVHHLFPPILPAEGSQFSPERELNRSRWLGSSQQPYNHDVKKTALLPFMMRMDVLGHLGSVIIDAGSGNLEVAPMWHADPDYLEPRVYMPSKGKKIIRVDWSLKGDGKRSHDIFEVAADLENFTPKNHLEAQRLLRLLRFLKIKPSALPEIADTVLLSDILNYVDAKQVIHTLSRLLKRGTGRMIIVNQNHMGLADVFSARRPESNSEIISLLKESGLTLEHASNLHASAHAFYPIIMLDEVRYARHRVVLVARRY